MSLPIFTSPSEDFTDIDFFELDVYVLMLEAFDPEGTEIQFQVVEEFGDGALFYITPDYNELAFIADPDFEDPSDLDHDNVYEVMVRAEDRDSEEDYRTIYVHVLDVDEGNNNPPEFVSAGFVEVAENPEVAVYIAEAQDPDGDPVTYEITGGADQHLFSIDPETGEVYFNDVLDYENPQDADGDNFYEIEITASDGYSESDSHSVVIQVTDLDDTAPVLEGDVDFSVEENTAEVPYAVVAYDPEGGDITYDLGGPDGHLFQLGPDGELSFFDAPDFEAPGDADSDNVYEINIVATDEAGNESAMQTVTVTVEDLSDSAPIITSTEDRAEFVENYYDAIYTVEAIDADISDTVTFRFSDETPDAGYFMIDEHSGAIYPMMPFDHEDPQDSDGDNVYELAIIASDGVNDSEDPFVLYVTILNENDNVPVVSEETAEVTVPENVDGPIYTAVALDDDGDELEYTLGGADAALFYLDSDTGELSFLAPPDFETALDEGGDNIYDVEIVASDGENESDALALAIEVTDLTEGGGPPVMTSAASASVSENTTGTVYVAEADDPDSDNVTFFISGGADAGQFAIDENSGELSFLAPPNFEARADTDHDNVYEVEIAASDGTFASDPLVVAITVTDIIGSVVLGTPATDNLTGTPLDDVVHGLASDDTLDGGAGDDTMFGGLGNDTYIVNSSFDTVAEASGAGIDQVNASVSRALGPNFENLLLIGTANINGFGNDLNNHVTGNSGNNWLDGRAGIDTMIGGTGNDIYVVDSPFDAVVENPGGGIDQINSSVTLTLGANIENLWLQGTASISGFGNALDNQLNGNGNNNTLDGLGGSDAMLGGQGSDTYFVDSVGDTVSELLNEGTDQIRTTVSYTLSGNVENMTLLGAVAIDGIGNNLNNLITGNSAANILDGRGGADSLFGRNGDDIYVVDNSSDSVVENAGEGVDTVRSFVNYALTPNVENLELLGSTHINGFGNALANTVAGNSGNNVLGGGLGNDVLIGGAGADSFFFFAPPNSVSNVDQISDFDLANDNIWLENSVFTSLTLNGSLGADSFVVGAAAADANDFIIYSAATGQLFYDADGNGAGAQVQFASVALNLALTHDAFLVL